MKNLKDCMIEDVEIFFVFDKNSNMFLNKKGVKYTGGGYGPASIEGYYHKLYNVNDGSSRNSSFDDAYECGVNYINFSTR